jgi:hypothetical protein
MTDPSAENDAGAARGVILLSPHIDLGPDDYHEWWHDRRAPLVGVDSRGRRNPRMIFATHQPWRCNNPDCTAEALVDETWIAQWLDLLDRSTRPGSTTP